MRAIFRAPEVASPASTCASAPSGNVQARARMLGVRGEPLFLGDWDRVLMIHFQIDPELLQPLVPFPLDLWKGDAYVTLVAFTLRNLRFRRGGRIGSWLCWPVGSNEFLNVRTYVKWKGESGIHFLAEWVPNLLGVIPARRCFALPYRRGVLRYDHQHETGRLRGEILDGYRGSVSRRLRYQAGLELADSPLPCPAGSREEWLMEHYSAFNDLEGRRCFFRVWHPPWAQIPATVELEDVSLLHQVWPCFRQARLIGANYSAGLREVWMGRPQRC